MKKQTKQYKTKKTSKINQEVTFPKQHLNKKKTRTKGFIKTKTRKKIQCTYF